MHQLRLQSEALLQVRVKLVELGKVAQPAQS